jgi:2-oxoglutarate ferredoxin oxidoreductase subunit delta
MIGNIERINDMSETVAEVQNPPEATARTKRGPRGKVTIFGMWCKGCMLCVEFCPTGVLAFKDEKVIVEHPENCTACHWCDTHCPDLAIIVKPVTG